MAIPSKSSRSFTSQIDWPIVGVAAVMAGVFVVCLTLTAWVAGRGISLPRSAWERVSGRSGGEYANESDALQASATRSVEALHSYAERGNEGLSPAQQVPLAVYPETDIAREASSGSAGGQRGRRDSTYQHTPSVPGARSQPGSAAIVAARFAGKMPALPDSEACCKLEFARDPAEAAVLAKQEHKLMFVLHVSGNFEESKFT